MFAFLHFFTLYAVAAMKPRETPKGIDKTGMELDGKVPVDRKMVESDVNADGEERWEPTMDALDAEDAEDDSFFDRVLDTVNSINPFADGDEREADEDELTEVDPLLADLLMEMDDDSGDEYDGENYERQLLDEWRDEDSYDVDIYT